MSKENFEKALQFLFPSEGGYVNDSKDSGGPTNMGVTQGTYNMYRKNQCLPPKDVKQITKEEAVVGAMSPDEFAKYEKEIDA